MRLVTLLELLHQHDDVDSGAQPLFDADTVSVVPGPTAQQVVIHGVAGVSSGRSRSLASWIDKLRPHHDEAPEAAEKPADAKLAAAKATTTAKPAAAQKPAETAKRSHHAKSKPAAK